MSEPEILSLHMRVDPVGITELVQGLWRDEGRKAHSLRVLVDGFGMNLHQAIAVASGQQHLVSDDGVDFTLDPEIFDEKLVEKEAMDLLNRMDAFEKMESKFLKAQEFATLIHAANGMPITRGPWANTGKSHASPAGYVTHKMAVEYIASYLPRPTDEEWFAFWDEHAENLQDIKDEQMRDAGLVSCRDKSTAEQPKPQPEPTPEEKAEAQLRTNTIITVMKVQNRCCMLDITSFVGTSIGAEHYYARLKMHGVEKDVELKHTLTQKEATYLNKKDKGYGAFGRYKTGEKVHRFDTEAEIRRVAIAEYKQHFPQAIGLMEGSFGSCQPKPILDGLDSIAPRVNQLAKDLEECYPTTGWKRDIIDMPRFKAICHEWEDLMTTVAVGLPKLETEE